MTSQEQKLTRYLYQQSLPIATQYYLINMMNKACSKELEVQYPACCATMHQGLTKHRLGSRNLEPLVRTYLCHSIQHVTLQKQRGPVPRHCWTSSATPHIDRTKHTNHFALTAQHTSALTVEAHPVHWAVLQADLMTKKSHMEDKRLMRLCIWRDARF